MSESDRRTARRASRPLEVKFWCDGASHQGRIEDLSETGAFISAGHFWPTHIHIELEFRLPDGSPDDSIKVEGTVVWAEQIGFGVNFEELVPADRERIRFFVEAEMFTGGRAAGGDLG